MDDNTPLMEAGIDSLSAVEFRNKARRCRAVQLVERFNALGCFRSSRLGWGGYFGVGIWGGFKVLLVAVDQVKKCFVNEIYAQSFWACLKKKNFLQPFHACSLHVLWSLFFNRRDFTPEPSFLCRIVMFFLDLSDICEVSSEFRSVRLPSTLMFPGQHTLLALLQVEIYPFGCTPFRFSLRFTTLRQTQSSLENTRLHPKKQDRSLRSFNSNNS